LRGAFVASDQRFGEALLVGLAQALLAIGDRPQLAGESELAERDKRTRQRPVVQARGQCHHHRQSPMEVSSISIPPTTFTNTSCSCSENTGMAVHRRQAASRRRLESRPLRNAPRRTESHPVHQPLKLNQQRAAAIARHGDDAAGCGLPQGGREKWRRGS
jgi:hypothetical protein